MNRINVWALGLATIGALVAATQQATPVKAQQPTRVCADSARRTQAVNVARAINTAQFRSARAQTDYKALSALGVAVPAGFSVQLIPGPSEYVFSVKDTQDPCKFTLFSDQEGLIYSAQPLQ